MNDDVKEKVAKYSFISVFQLLTKLAVIIMMIIYVAYIPINAMKQDSWIVGIAKQHFVTTIGLPFMALLSYFIVTTLESRFSKIEFKAIGFEFKGASGPIVLWILCFLAMAVAVKINW